MRSSSNSGSKKQKINRSKTNQCKCDGGDCKNSLYIVGIGPGNPDHLSKRAHDVLISVDTIAGYTTYIELIKPLIQNKNLISTGMTKEVERVEAAIDNALEGKSCAIVSSGDPGIYAMAGLVFEVCEKRNIGIFHPNTDVINTGRPALQVEVIPGIPALCAGASILGAPLTHDFAAISLSDLLTPWDLIEKRLEAAAKADFVIVLYNPKSKKRTEQLRKAQEIVLKHRGKKTMVGFVTKAMRKDQEVSISTLEEMHHVYADMQTIVFIGSSASRKYMDFMITPRGYAEKYKMGM